ncbi:MAG: hypothetical protein OXG04_15455 [Acidobacteria bacterium]|nr:hypothetical protein [Acidobacteriota bacterium]
MHVDAEPIRAVRWNGSGASMSVMLSKTYTAHKAADVADDVARDAAEAVGSLAVSLTVIKWMVGFMLGLQVAAIAMLFQIALRLD